MVSYNRTVCLLMGTSVVSLEIPRWAIFFFFLGSRAPASRVARPNQTGS
jgi:hypothetical protein